VMAVLKAGPTLADARLWAWSWLGAALAWKLRRPSRTEVVGR
jgi:hypothetical protein